MNHMQQMPQLTPEQAQLADLVMRFKTLISALMGMLEKRRSQLASAQHPHLLPGLAKNAAQLAKDLQTFQDNLDLGKIDQDAWENAIGIALGMIFTERQLSLGIAGKDIVGNITHLVHLAEADLAARRGQA